MRFNEFEPSIEESAADELKRKLPSLRKTDYDTIDRLMQRISKRYRISGDKLHDIFVKKYKHTPDHWIKKYREKLGETEIKEVDEEEAIKKFIDWSIKMVNLQEPYPKIHLSKDTEKAQKLGPWSNNNPGGLVFNSKDGTYNGYRTYQDGIAAVNEYYNYGVGAPLGRKGADSLLLPSGFKESVFGTKTEMDYILVKSLGAR